MVNQIIFSSILQTWYVELRISRSISESRLEFEITTVYSYAIIIRCSRPEFSAICLNSNSFILYRLRFYNPATFSRTQLLCHGHHHFVIYMQRDFFEKHSDEVLFCMPEDGLQLLLLSSPTAIYHFRSKLISKQGVASIVDLYKVRPTTHTEDK